VARKTRSIDCLASKLVGWEDRIIEGQAMSFATICRHDENFSHRKRTIRANERQLLSIRRKSGAQSWYSAVGSVTLCVSRLCTESKLIL